METVVTSVTNQTIKKIRKLKTSSKARRDENTYIAEGAHLVKSFLLTEKVPLLYFCAESALANQEVAELVDKLESTAARRLIVADSLFESITSVHATSGIAILFEPPKIDSLLPLSKNTVILESIQDPGNVGTILRVASATGTADVILSPDSASAWSPKALRAGMGAQFSLNIHEEADLEAITKTAQIPILATTLSTSSQSLYSLDLTGPVAWIFGNEGQGVSEALAATSSVNVFIPQASSTVESLNVSAAAAVCLYEQYRQSII